MKPINYNKKKLNAIEKANIALKQKTTKTTKKTKKEQKKYAIKACVRKRIKAKNKKEAKYILQKEITSKTILDDFDIGEYSIEEMKYKNLS